MYILQTYKMPLESPPYTMLFLQEDQFDSI